MTVTMDRLKRRLDRVEALHRGATTAGERTAAARARDRLAARIDQLRSDDPVAQFVRAHLQSLVEAPTWYPPEPPAALPTEQQILAILALWEAGDWHWRDVHAWATVQVDSVDLPLGSDDSESSAGRASRLAAEGIARAEVLLQLAMLHRVDLRTSDVPEIRRFLHEREWSAWFHLVARAPRCRRA